MPIVTLETSVMLSGDERTAALRTLVASAKLLLAIAPPTELRLRLVDVPPGTWAVGEAIGDASDPWVVAYVDVLAGRPDDQLADFMTEFAAVIADVLHVDVAKVRILVQNFPKPYWQIGRRSAAAAGR
jgi:phenylpyruvate tautomerase PptA (4-oxalocrotonate tautomerase family)